jgi:hypothetical protein
VQKTEEWSLRFKLALNKLDLKPAVKYSAGLFNNCHVDVYILLQLVFSAHFINNEASCYLLLTDHDRFMQYVGSILQTKWQKLAMALNLKPSNQNTE